MKRKCERLAKRNFYSCKPVVYTALGMVLLVFLMPLLLLIPGAGRKEEAVVPYAEGAQPADSSVPQEEEEKTPVSDTLDGSLTLTVYLDGENQTMTMEEYLWGVVAAEMPAAFAQEALNAQAIAARTYTLYRLSNPSSNHPGADICGDPGCCQAWMSREERLEQWDKRGSEEYAAKITEAIQSTDGLALYYGDSPILAAFHAASAGSTKSALEVWGENIPYLQGVESPEDDSSVPNYYSTVEVDKETFVETFSAAYPKADLSAEDCGSWFGEETYDEEGLPSTIEIGGEVVDTAEVRTLFELRSASFTVECQGDTITFYVTGYGHGVGMSQYGANALAKEGKTAQEILEWYYTGAELRKMEG